MFISRITTRTVYPHMQKQKQYSWTLCEYTNHCSCRLVAGTPFTSQPNWLIHRDKSRPALTTCLLPELLIIQLMIQWEKKDTYYWLLTENVCCFRFWMLVSSFIWVFFFFNHIKVLICSLRWNITSLSLYLLPKPGSLGNRCLLLPV